MINLFDLMINNFFFNYIKNLFFFNYLCNFFYNYISDGTHILADYTGIYGNEEDIGNFIFDLMIRTIDRTSMKIVHKHLSILQDDTPPGFTSVLLLDSSHFSSHCYSDK